MSFGLSMSVGLYKLPKDVNLAVKAAKTITTTSRIQHRLRLYQDTKQDVLLCTIPSQAIPTGRNSSSSGISRMVTFKQAVMHVMIRFPEIEEDFYSR
jgi:hypothetical protein